VAELITQLGPLLLAVVVPIIIAGVKKVVPLIPGWLIPIIAPAVGYLANLISGLLGGVKTDSAFAAALLGLAGVGIREIFDQIKKVLTEPAA